MTVKLGEYRILAYYGTFFGQTAYKLQRRSRFLFWEYWETIRDDRLGMVYRSWVDHYRCEIVNSEED